ncbi:MAG: hypothetical protein EB127_24135, partial [Alphaproteobacteria bacterium]|nr:hypothetical protein [Alphaproteobacteria bacterium]
SNHYVEKFESNLNDVDTLADIIADLLTNPVGSEKALRLDYIPGILLAPLNIFGQAGFSKLPLWTPGYWTSNMFVIWWATFLMLTYLRK